MIPALGALWLQCTALLSGCCLAAAVSFAATLWLADKRLSWCAAPSGVHKQDGMDSWEDETPPAVPPSQSAGNPPPKAAQGGGAALNASAPSFNFNPGASSFNPVIQSFVPAQSRSEPESAVTISEPSAPPDVSMAEPSTTGQEDDTAMEEPADEGADRHTLRSGRRQLGLMWAPEISATKHLSLQHC